jgi:hypothetical protein
LTIGFITHNRTLKYNTTESLRTPSVFQLTTEYHSNSAAIITAATLVTGELQVPFLFPGYQLQTPNSLDTTTLRIPTTHDSNPLSGIYDLRADGREDAFSEKRPFLGTDSEETFISRYLGNLPCCLGSEPQRARHNILHIIYYIHTVPDQRSESASTADNSEVRESVEDVKRDPRLCVVAL